MTTAIIGGSGFTSLQQFKTLDSLHLSTPYGATSSDILQGELSGEPCLFLARHGQQHTIAPHKINYRANIYALKQLNVKRIIALAAVGGIGQQYVPGAVCVPNQIIDYTYGREATYYDGQVYTGGAFENKTAHVAHAEFTEPYSYKMREAIIQVAQKMKLPLIANATYAVTQGPRFETAAEIQRLKQDGAHIVGMTGMPECSLARELQIDYLTLASSVNYAAGIAQTDITMDKIREAMQTSSTLVYRLLPKLLKAVSGLASGTPELIKP